MFKHTDVFTHVIVEVHSILLSIYFSQEAIKAIMEKIRESQGAEILRFLPWHIRFIRKLTNLFYPQSQQNIVDKLFLEIFSNVNINSD